MRYWYEVTFLVPPVWEEVLPGLLEDMGFSGIWSEDEGKQPYGSVLKAYIPEKDWHSMLKESLAAHLERLSYVFSKGNEKGWFEVRKIEEEDWASKWLPFFEPIKIGSVWIRPGEKIIALAEGEREIILDPGQAFGTGHHETTRLCMEALLALHEKLKRDAPLLDLGTGSGILAMFAARIGFNNILAVDIDPTAIETARKNLAVNGFSNGLEGSRGGPIQVLGTPISEITEQFSLILANLTTHDLIVLSKILEKRMIRKGWLVVSGILETETKKVVEAFYDKRMELMERYKKNQWVCLVFEKP